MWYEMISGASWLTGCKTMLSKIYFDTISHVIMALK